MIKKYYADYCQPCKVLSKLISDFGLEDKFENVDTESDEGMVEGTKMGVRTIPTLIDGDNAYVGIKECSEFVKGMK